MWNEECGMRNVRGMWNVECGMRNVEDARKEEGGRRNVRGWRIVLSAFCIVIVHCAA
jgi:hypothetical protein